MWRFLRGISLTWWIIIAMVIGIFIGWADHTLWKDTDVAAKLQPLSTIFLRLIKSIVVPLVFSSLVIGIAGHVIHHDSKLVGPLPQPVPDEEVTTLGGRVLLLGTEAQVLE